MKGSRGERGGKRQLRRVLMTAFDLLCICLTSMCVPVRVCVWEEGRIVVVVVYVMLLLLSVAHFIIL